MSPVPPGRKAVPYSTRLRLVRLNLYGELGVPSIAADLGVSAEDWREFEAGREMPGRLVLRFLCLTGVNPHWLATGEGWPYLQAEGPRPAPSLN